MFAFVIAAACLWRGLTQEEATAVEQEVAELIDGLDIDAMTAGEARDVLDAAIAAVLVVSRP